MLLKYLKRSASLGLVYKKNEAEEIEGYCDSNYAAGLDKRRSLTGYSFTLEGNVISWKVNLQHVVALSSTEAKYVALTEAIKEGMWLQGITKELGFKEHVMRVHCDSQSAIHLSKNNAFHEMAKYIDVRLHPKQIKVEKISTLVNPADMLTKVIPVSKFKESLDL